MNAEQKQTAVDAPRLQDEVSEMPAEAKADDLVRQMRQLNDEIQESIKELTKRGNQWNTDSNPDKE